MTAMTLMTLPQPPIRRPRDASCPGATARRDRRRCAPAPALDGRAGGLRLKPILAASALAVALLTGCASGGPPLVLEPVGPPPTPPPAARTTGSLVVYSALEIYAHCTSVDPDRYEYTDYRILSEQGTLVRKVHNDSDTVIEGPVTVDLPPGTYRVVARAGRYGWVTVPVVIAANRVTTVHLEDGAPWLDKAARSRPDLVRLPDGQIVGYKARPGAAPNP